MRFYDVDGGAILLGGRDIREMPRSELREHYGMVLQDTWLSDGTIRDNIAFARPDATDEEIIAAAKAAHAHGFIKKLPHGYNTVIGEGGGALSQGQKQLLCIARIMLTDPEILILDEATSSIDTRTEIRIQKAFKKLMAGRTAFIVAHRLSTIKGSDVILVMKDGNVIEQGTHDELLERGGFYNKLYNSQFPDAN
jgi:ATP-binding cassette subfamily B protein